MEGKIKIIYLILGILLLLLLIAVSVIWILQRIEINWSYFTFYETSCKKEMAKSIFDTNTYLNDLSQKRWTLVPHRNEIIELISTITNKDKRSIELLIKDESLRFANVAGWGQMTRLKVRDLTGDTIDWETLDYKTLLNKYCKRPKFIKLK